MTPDRPAVQWRAPASASASVHAFQPNGQETHRSKALVPLCGNARAALALRDVTAVASAEATYPPARACKACVKAVKAGQA